MNEKRYRAVLFDLGGTLRIALEDEPYMRHARRKMTELAGAPLQVEDFYQLVEDRYESYRRWALGEDKESGDQELWCKWLLPDYDPQRIAILDMASLDILDALGVGDRVVGTASTSLDYLQSYINEDIANLGTIKEADLEAVMSCEPDVIFIGGRLASSYDALSEIAPVVYLSTDTE